MATDILPDFPELPPVVTVEVSSSDFGPTNVKNFGICFQLLLGRDISLTFSAGGGNRSVLLGSFQAKLPPNFNVLPAREQMKILRDQPEGLRFNYFCRDSEKLLQLGPEKFRRVASYGDVLDDEHF